MLTGRTYEFDIEVMFFNVVDQVGLQYKYSFTRTEDGIYRIRLESYPIKAVFKKSRRVQPFYPKTFDSDSDSSSRRYWIIIFRALFVLSLLTQLIKILAIDIFKSLKIFFQTHKLVLPL